jgi:hypothetical protein
MNVKSLMFVAVVGIASACNAVAQVGYGSSVPVTDKDQQRLVKDDAHQEEVNKPSSSLNVLADAAAITTIPIIASSYVTGPVQSADQPKAKTFAMIETQAPGRLSPPPLPGSVSGQHQRFLVSEYPAPVDIQTQSSAPPSARKKNYHYKAIAVIGATIFVVAIMVVIF